MNAATPAASDGDAPDSVIADGRPCVLLPLEAKLRGFRNRLSFRRWCHRRGVPIRRDGRFEWVCPADVDAAVGAVPIVRVSSASVASKKSVSPVVDPVAAAVDALMLRGRKR